MRVKFIALYRDFLGIVLFIRLYVRLTGEGYVCYWQGKTDIHSEIKGRLDSGNACYRSTHCPLCD